MMKEIKTVHIITKLELGGAQVNTIHTYENLDALHFDSYLISGPGGILTERVKKKENLILLSNLDRRINPVKDLKAFFQLYKTLRRIDPAIVHTHSSKAGILGRLAAFLLQVPVIIHSVHGFSFSPFQSFFKRTFFYVAEKLTTNMTDHFIFVSRDDIDIAKEKKLVADNFSLIRSGFPFQKFLNRNESTGALRENYNIEESDFVIGIIAPFKPQKGLFHLIEIAEKVIQSKAVDKKIVFMITGDGALREPIEAKLKEKGIFENFRLPGFVFDIENAIDVFDMGVSTALWEGLPQSLVQLRLKKKAVVASNIPGNREVIRENENGFLVDVTDYDSFAQKITTLITNPDTHTRLANCEEDFSSWNADFMVKEQEDLYKRLMA